MHLSVLLSAASLLSSAVLCQDGGGRPVASQADPLTGYTCDPSKCQPPSCRCASKTPPVSNPPQFLMLTFDDSIQASTVPQARSLFQSLTNPNGCPARATWFAQVFYSDPFLATQWYAQGNEIADHSVTHAPPFAGSYQELEGMRAWATSLAGIPRGKIQGVRFPLRNYSVEALNTLSKMGFTYDSSLAASPSERVWPYTLDYGSVSDCSGQLSVCGKQLNAPGLWEVPMYAMESKNGLHLMDPYNDPSLASPMPLQDVTDGYRATFDQHYANGRVPFGVYLHPLWIGPSTSPSIPDGTGKREAVFNFLKYAMGRPDVWMVTPSQVIEYMKNPVPASELGSQPYMQCRTPSVPTTICNGLSDAGLDICNLPNGTLRSCYGCPSEYPSLANPAPKMGPTAKCPVPDSCDTVWWDPAGCKCLCSSASCEWKDGSRPIQLGQDGPSTNGSTDGSSKSKNGVVSMSPLSAMMGYLLLLSSILLFF